MKVRLPTATVQVVVVVDGKIGGKLQEIGLGNAAGNLQHLLPDRREYGSPVRACRRTWMRLALSGAAGFHSFHGEIIAAP